MNGLLSPLTIARTIARYWPRFWMLLGACVLPAIAAAAGAQYPCHFWFLAIVFAPLLIVVYALPIALVGALPATLLPLNRLTSAVVICLSLGLAAAAYHAGVVAPPPGRCDL